MIIKKERERGGRNELMAGLSLSELISLFKKALNFVGVKKK